MSDEITQQTLLPGVKDPNLWMVKCRIGEEKSTVLLLMRKYITYQYSGKMCISRKSICTCQIIFCLSVMIFVF